jgi:hypothetical protein
MLSLSPLNIDDTFHTLLLLMFSSISQTDGIEAACAGGIVNFNAIN